LNKGVPDSVLESRRFGRSGTTSIWLEAESIAKVAKLVKFDDELKMDWLENFSLVEFEEVLVATYFVVSSITRKNVILRISVAPRSPLERVSFPSVRSVWPMIEPMEREASDLFGVNFKEESGNEDLKVKSSILPENWIGYPLRKGYHFPKEVYGLMHARADKKIFDKKAEP
jgi:NADH:ubiquinone oxidoreductase subunit C